VNLDNTAFTLFWKCPLAYFERYESEALVGPERVRKDVGGSGEANGREATVLPILRERKRGIELDAPAPGRDFGKRFHELCENSCRNILRLPQRCFVPLADGALEAECQSVFAQYVAHYIGDPLQILETERTHIVEIPQTPHGLVVKLDRVVRFSDGTIGPFDTKTENAPGNNFRENWAGRTQASFYLWACTQLFPKERVSRLVVDVVTRGNAKKAPSFSRLDDISRPPEALEDAIRSFVWVCDRIEECRASGFWPANMNVCKDGWRKCDFYSLHVMGRTEANLKLYRPAEDYLGL